MLTKITVDPQNQSQPDILAARCPHCGHDASFEGVGPHDINGQNNIEGVMTHFKLGIRRCPRAECHGQLFFQTFGAETMTFPALVIDFIPDDIPKPIGDTFQEALQCEAIGCYTASAIMVRKTLEMICEERSATGDKLIDRLKSLKTQVSLPTQLFDAMDNLRLLGNDAAHVELKDFDKIGKDELSVAIDLTKEVLKSLYQLDSIVNRLKAMKKPTATDA